LPAYTTNKFDILWLEEDELAALNRFSLIDDAKILRWPKTAIIAKIKRAPIKNPSIEMPIFFINFLISRL
jgi:hypothetical protein